MSAPLQGWPGRSSKTSINPTLKTQRKVRSSWRLKPSCSQKQPGCLCPAAVLDYRDPLVFTILLSKITYPVKMNFWNVNTPPPPHCDVIIKWVLKKNVWGQILVWGFRKKNPTFQNLIMKPKHMLGISKFANFYSFAQIGQRKFLFDLSLRLNVHNDSRSFLELWPQEEPAILNSAQKSLRN